MIDTHVHAAPGWIRDVVARELDSCKLDKALVAATPLDHWRAAMADTCAGAGTVRLDIAWPGGSARGIGVTLPGGQDAGKSAVISLD